MKKQLIILGFSTILSAFEYKIHPGNQMLGAVDDITNLSIFKNKCVNYLLYRDFTNDRFLAYGANVGINFQEGINPLTSLKKGQGFIANASGYCSVNIDEDIIKFHRFKYKKIVSPTTNRIWLDRNLGAKRPCTKTRAEFSSDEDYVESQKDCFGDYYQWGRLDDGHQKAHSETQTELQDNYRYRKTNSKFVITDSFFTYYDWLKKGVDTDGRKRQAILRTEICPTGFRVPTITELKAEATNLDNLINVLKFPQAGFRTKTRGDFAYYGSGMYWSLDTSLEEGSKYSFHIIFGESFSEARSRRGRAAGLSIRCIKGD